MHHLRVLKCSECMRRPCRARQRTCRFSIPSFTCLSRFSSPSPGAQRGYSWRLVAVQIILVFSMFLAQSAHDEALKGTLIFPEDKVRAWMTADASVLLINQSINQLQVRTLEFEVGQLKTQLASVETAQQRYDNRFFVVSSETFKPHCLRILWQQVSSCAAASQRQSRNRAVCHQQNSRCHQRDNSRAC